MRTFIEEVKVYKFNELSDEAKQKAIENLHDLNTSYDWDQFITDDFKEKMNAIGFVVSNTYFSGFWSQGDGACFEG